MEVEMETEPIVKIPSSNISVKSGSSKRSGKTPINMRKIPVPLNRLEQSNFKFTLNLTIM
jgi:hypothetical protein